MLVIQTPLLRKSMTNVLQGFPWKSTFGLTNQKHSHSDNMTARETITQLSAGINISTGLNNQFENEGTNQDVRE